MHTRGGTVTPFYGFNPESDCKKLHSAMGGFMNTDHRAITSIICYRSNEQRQALKTKYLSMYDKHLEEELSDELSGSFGEAIQGLMVPASDFAAYCVKHALSSSGTDQKLAEIIVPCTSDEILKLKESFKRLYDKDLEEEVSSETSGTIEQILMSLLKKNRDSDGCVDQKMVKKDAMALYKAGEDKFGTDNDVFVEVLGSRSFAHLRAVYEEYKKVSSGSTIEKALHDEMSGNTEDVFLAIVEVSRSRAGYFASCLHQSKHGFLTYSTPYTIISRSERDLVQIKEVYKSRYKMSLYSSLTEQESGDYGWCLQAICRD